MLLALPLGPFSSPAQAQNLAAYRQMTAALEEVPAARSQSPAEALARLDKAGAAFKALRPTLEDSHLRAQLTGVLQQSRGALARTPAELQAQTTFAQALLRQALYDQTMRDLMQDGWTESTRSRLGQLAQDFELNNAEEVALLQAAQAGRLRAAAARLQAAAARRVVRTLEPWGRGEQVPPTAAYLRLSEASGWHLHLSGLPGAAPQADYSRALGVLAGGTDASAEQAAPQIRLLYAAALKNARNLQDILDTGRAAAQGAAAAPPTASSSGSEDAEPLVALELTYGALGRALGALGQYQPGRARAELRRAETSIQTWPQGWQEREGGRLAAHIRAAARQPGLNAGDITRLIALLGEAERRLQGPAASGKEAGAEPRNPLWNGQTQAIAFFVLPLLPLPLYYGYRALGWRERPWQLVAAGTALLLLPLLLEGIAAVGGWLGDLLGQPGLAGLARLSLRFSDLGQLLWWLLSLAGVLLLTRGFALLDASGQRTRAQRQQWNRSRHSPDTAPAAQPGGPSSRPQ